MRERLARVVATACLLSFSPAPAQHEEPDVFPVIREIEFQGNKTTQPKVLLREMYVRVGDEARPALIERSRQSILDLGLFRSVHIQEDPVPGGVRLIVFLREKIYILPVPRISASSDGGYSFGAQLRWNNVLGLNQRFVGYWARMQSEEGKADEEERGLATRYSISYRYPYVQDEPYDLHFGAAYTETPVTEGVTYEERSEQATVTVMRRLNPGPGSKGWRIGGGLEYRRQDTSGEGAPAPYGRATAVALQSDYQDVHYRIYSDEGQRFWSRLESATAGVGSDYHYVQWQLAYERLQPFGLTPHQTFSSRFSINSRHGGPRGEEAFELGGSQSLRGFEPESAQGDFAYLAQVEILRPLWSNSYRGLIVVEAGNAFTEPGDAHLERVLVSAGIGLRVRVQAFVDLDLEIGLAWPLNGGAPRVFATKV